MLLLSEPWMHFDKFLAKWLNRLNFKLFSLNKRNYFLPNIWLICKQDLNPIIIDCDNQNVVFTIKIMNTTIGIVVLYAQNCHMVMRSLWNNLASLARAGHPWCFIGHFNIILGCHEHKGNYLPAKAPIADLQMWIDSNDLFHIPT